MKKYINLHFMMGDTLVVATVFERGQDSNVIENYWVNRFSIEDSTMFSVEAEMVYTNNELTFSKWELSSRKTCTLHIPRASVDKMWITVVTQD